MDCNIDKLYAIKNGGELTPMECIAINRSLAKLKLEDIPMSQRRNVSEYMLSALNISSVDAQLIPAFDILLKQLG